MNKFIAIPHIRVQHANALQSWWLMAPPSPMTVYGFARALGLKAGLSCTSLAMIHHDVQWLGKEKSSARFIPKRDVRFRNRTIWPQQPQGATYISYPQDHIASRFSKGLQPTARCHVEMSVIIAVDELARVDLPAIDDFLWSGRLGGGTIIGHGTVAICASSEEVLGKFRTGFWVVDRSDLVSRAMTAGDVDGTEAVINVLKGNSQEREAYRHLSEEERKRVEKPASWLSINTVGYAALEPPTSRIGVRGGAPHAYAEPLCGVIQYHPVRWMQHVPLWQYQPCPAKGVYLMKGV